MAIVEIAKTIMFYLVFATISIIFSFLCLGLLRKIKAKMQNRKGPPITQPIWDFLKLLGKEEIYEETSQDFLLILSLFFALISSILVFSLIFSLIQNINFLMLVYFLTFPQILICLAGISSKNIYSMIGGERGIIQSIFSEIIFILGSSFLLYTIFHTLNIYTEMSYKPTPLLIIPLAILYIPVLMSIIAQVNLNPFSMSDAHQEIITGYATEFSGLAYACYMLSKSLKFLSLMLITSFIFFGIFFKAKKLAIFLFSAFILFLTSWISASLPRIKISRYIKISLMLILLEILGGLLLYVKVT